MAQRIRQITDSLVGFFSSLKLAVTLLILLALVSVLGTFVPQEQDPAVYIQRYGGDTYAWLKHAGLIDLYHSWGFRLLMGLITVNLLVCTMRRLRGVYRRTVSPAAEKTAGEIAALRLSNTLPSPEKAPVIERALSDKRFNVVRRGRFIYGSKGIIGIWGDMVTHLSILMVITGGLVGSTGFVSTVNVYVGGWSDSAYNWSAGRDEPLGFRLAVENFNVRYYPMRMRLAVRQASTGSKVFEFDAMEGGLVNIPGTELSVSPEGVDLGRREALLKIYNRGRLAGLYDTGIPAGGPAAPIAMDYVFYLESLESPVPMSVASSVSLSRDSVVFKRGVVEVNRPLRVEGLSIYQTAYDRDPQGRPYTGFQIVRDPGIPLVWTGFVLLIIGLYISFFHSHRQVWAYVGDDAITLGGSTSKDWPGFMTEYGGLIKTFMQELY